METNYKIEAIIRPSKLNEVQDALELANLRGITVSDARGTGNQKATTHTFRGSQYGHVLMPHIRIEVIVTGAQLESALDAIQQSARTGEVGDGKIVVTALHEVVRIRTGERGSAALS